MVPTPAHFPIHLPDEAMKAITVRCAVDNRWNLARLAADPHRVSASDMGTWWVRPTCGTTGLLPYLVFDLPAAAEIRYGRA